MVGGYECWNVNEQYFTVNDLGEICQVIDLNQMEWTPVENNSEAVAMFSLRSGRNEVDVSGDNTYSGTIDATQSDYTTPVFTGWTLNDPYSNIYPDEKISYVIRCDDFVFSRQHLAEIHIYNDVEGEFLLGNTTNLVFSTFIKTAYLVNGAWNNAPTKIYVTFPKGDGNKKVTNYSVYTKTKKY